MSGLLASGDSQLNSQRVFDSLVARERLGTTGLGAGIAIPHGRVDNKNGFSLGAFMRTTRPVDFDAVDGTPVDLFFALCVPEKATQEHLTLLSMLARMFSDPALIDDLRSGSSQQAVYSLLIEER